jgi:lipoprotein-releasing system permease protein
VKDKTRDIAIMRTMGATKGSILRIFMMTGSAIGFIGTALGAIFGITFAANIEKIRRVLESFLHMDLFSAEIYFLTQLPSQLNLNEVFWVVLMALSLSFLATLYPAFKASKLDPAEALRF